MVATRLRERIPSLELVRIIAQAHSRLALLSVILMLAAGALPSITAVLSGVVISQLLAQMSRGMALGTPQVIGPMVGLAALFVLQQLVTMLRVGACEALAARTNEVVTGRLMRATLAPRTIAHLEDAQLLDLISRVRGRGWFTMEYVSLAFLNQQTTRLQGIAALILVGQFQPVLAPIIFCGFLFRNYVLARAQAQMMGVSAQRARVFRGADYLRDLALQAPAAKEVRVYGLADWLVQRFERTWLAGMGELWRQRPQLGRMLVYGSLPLVVAACLSIVLMTQSLAAGVVSIAGLMVYGQALAITFRTMGFFSGDENTLEEGLHSLPALLELEQRLTSESEFQPSGTRSAEGLPSSEIRFEGVCFRYPGQERDVLHDLDLTLHAGVGTAIVGDNGAGKTTLIKLLARLYEPTAGRIMVDGISLNELDQRSWQRQFSALFQDFQRYSLSAADNVGFGQLERSNDRGALEAASRDAQSLGVIESLPNGWDTVLSRQFSGGTDLSGGQWQRVALARALMAAQRSGSVLILDEPTAHLDIRGEAAFYDHFLDLTRGRTTIVISHRFSTVRRADTIVVLDDGHVVEHGSHAELMSAAGRYARLFELQATRFSEPVDARAG